MTTSKNKKNQIDWIKNFYLREEMIGGCLPVLDPNDIKFESEFIMRFGFEVTRKVWLTRIKEAARDLGLKRNVFRNHDGCPAAGIPCWGVIYVR